MKTAQIENNKIVVKETPDLTLGKNKGAIVKVHACGLCGSDIVKLQHSLAKDGTVLGHEIVGEIIEINSDTNFKINDKIVSAHHIPCKTCNYCRHENYSMCEHFKTTNFLPGGFSERVFLSEEHLKNVAYKVPDSVSEEVISFYEPLACCIRAIKRCDLISGDKVLTIGLGSIGLLMSEAIKSYGYEVYGCDLLEERINLANERGIKSFNSGNPEEFYKTVQKLTQDEGFDAIFMTSGADKTIELALKVIRKGGKILVFSSTPNNFGYPNNSIYYNELTVKSSYSASPEDLKDSFEMLVNNKVNVKNITTVYALDDIQKAVDDTISNKIFKAYIKISN